MGFSSALNECLGDQTPCFQPCQIVCLEHETSCLYAEVIQIVESRHRCWVRPLVLILQSTEALTQDDALQTQPNCYDLRQDSDLLLPLTLFRVALDTELLPWLTSVYADNPDLLAQDNAARRGHAPFRQFIQQVWQAHANVFQNSPTLKKT